MNIEKLKDIQIVCRNPEQVKNCLNYLEQLGFDIDDFSAYYYYNYNIIFWEEIDKRFIISNKLKEHLKIEFYNKKFIKTLQKFIKEKEKQKLPDFEVAEDGRITKINNWESEKCLYFIGARDYGTINFDDFKKEGFYIKLGLLYLTKEARDKAMFRTEIETKLKNIAERLNAGRKIDWSDSLQAKINIVYECDEKILRSDSNYCCRIQGVIYCLDKNFLKVAKKEIGDEDLIKYFKD